MRHLPGGRLVAALLLPLLFLAPSASASVAPVPLPRENSLATVDAANLSAFDCSTVTQIPLAECQALIALYNSTNGPGWKRHGNWLVTDTPCSWDGVSCSGRHVSQLDVRRFGLSGTIPPQLADLSNLQVLGLGTNQLSGPIPPQLGQLGGLTWVRLDDNRLSGPIPPQLGKLSNLGCLVLSNNQLSGPIPPQLGNLSRMAWLELSNNQLSGPIPPDLGNLGRQMAFLMLDGNQLSGRIPPELGKLVNLYELNLSNNRLTGSVPDQLGNLHWLREMYINNNLLAGPLPLTLSAIDLSYFYFDHTNLCEPANESFQTWLARRASRVHGTGICIEPPPTPLPTPTPVCSIPDMSSPYSLRLNAGGDVYTDSTGLVWQADRDYGYCPGAYWGATGGQGYATTAPVDNTTDDVLYQSERYFAGPAGYRFAVPNGRYQITLRFAEIYPYAYVGSRVFDVRAEGQTMISGLDVLVRSGGLNRAYDITATVPVSDGELNLDFLPLPGHNAPFVNAIAITDATNALLFSPPLRDEQPLGSEE